MKSKKHEGFSRETKESVDRAQHGYCRLCDRRIADFHHRVHNTATNRKLFPVFIQSIFNCVGLCRQCHTHKTHLVSILLDEAVEYEQALRELKGDENVEKGTG